LSWLRQTGRRYIIGAPKSELKKFADTLADTAGWREVRKGVEVKLTRCPDTDETVLCRSAERRSKEQAMHEKFSKRTEAALKRLAGRTARSKRRLDREEVNRIGRILQQNQRAARRFKVRLAEDSAPAGFRLDVHVNASFDDGPRFRGRYLLRSNVTDWKDEQLSKAYIQLTQAEAAFRIQKDQLKVRPVRHSECASPNMSCRLSPSAPELQPSDQCSDDFSPKALICLEPVADSAQVRLRRGRQRDSAFPGTSEPVSVFDLGPFEHPALSPWRASAIWDDARSGAC
jgi:hypothetical protein